MAVIIFDQVESIVRQSDGSPDSQALHRIQELTEHFRQLEVKRSPMADTFLGSLEEHARAIFSPVEAHRTQSVEQAKECVPGDIRSIMGALRPS